jgi:hypothetical protein
MLVIVTVAPATIAPLGSVTVPSIEPAVVCALSGATGAKPTTIDKTIQTKIAQSVRRDML